MYNIKLKEYDYVVDIATEETYVVGAVNDDGTYTCLKEKNDKSDKVFKQGEIVRYSDWIEIQEGRMLPDGTPLPESEWEETWERSEFHEKCQKLKSLNAKKEFKKPDNKKRKKPKRKRKEIVEED